MRKGKMIKLSELERYQWGRKIKGIMASGETFGSWKARAKEKMFASMVKKYPEGNLKEIRAVAAEIVEEGFSQAIF